MRCVECNHTAEIKKIRAYRYEGVGVDNLYLLNAEVLSCPGCMGESLILHQVQKLHAEIGIAVAVQPARLSGTDIRFLRRSGGFSQSDWSQRIGVAEATYSKWENGHRPITPQADRLARLNFLSVLNQKDPANFRLAEYVSVVLSTNITQRRDFAIAVDAEKVGAEAIYLPLDSQLLTTPEAAFVEAQTLRSELQATVEIRVESVPNSPASAAIDSLIGETRNARIDLALAA